MNQRRRKDDGHSPTLVGAAKATAGFIGLSILSFIGSWGISLNGTVANIKEDVSNLKNKEQLITPWFVDEMKRTRDDIKELRVAIDQLNRQLADSKERIRK